MAELRKTRKKNSSKKTITIKPPTVKKGMKDYNDDPFFEKKAEAAYEIIKKYGLPETGK